MANGMANAHREIIKACSNGDIRALETLFEKFNIGSDHPRDQYQMDRNTPYEEQLPPITAMFCVACADQQIEAILFLYGRFPGSDFADGPVQAAIRYGNAEVLRLLCKLNPSVVNAGMGDDEEGLVLGYAAIRGESEMVKILLEAGADPNMEPPLRLSHNFSCGIWGNLPLSTFELFYDAGYDGRDMWFSAVTAVSESRPDVLELLFRKSSHLPDNRFPDKEYLISEANKNKDRDMVALIRRLYAARKEREKGLISRVLGKLRPKKLEKEADEKSLLKHV